MGKKYVPLNYSTIKQCFGNYLLYRAAPELALSFHLVVCSGLPPTAVRLCSLWNCASCGILTPGCSRAWDKQHDDLCAKQLMAAKAGSADPCEVPQAPCPERHELVEACLWDLLLSLGPFTLHI